MAEAGLLQGRRATLHWDELDRFAERFPEVTACPERIVEDGHIVTCGGASTAFDLMLAQIAAQHGAMLRMEVAGLFMQAGPGAADPPPLRSDNAVVEAAMALMRRHLEAPLPVAAIARRLGLSPRALERHCAQALGRGPAAVYRALRLTAARRLAEGTALPVAEIAARTGYEDASALTRAYRRAFGRTPSQHRAAARSAGAPLPNPGNR
jgi:AraC family carnitine catabolism transcriptional activator